MAKAEIDIIKFLTNIKNVEGLEPDGIIQEYAKKIIENRKDILDAFISAFMSAESMNGGDLPCMMKNFILVEKMDHEKMTFKYWLELKDPLKDPE